jgi:hypothetical protein
MKKEEAVYASSSKLHCFARLSLLAIFVFYVLDMRPDLLGQYFEVLHTFSDSGARSIVLFLIELNKVVFCVED